MKEKLMEEGMFSVLMNDGGEEVDPITGEKVVKTGEEDPEVTPGEETTPPGKKEGEEETPPPSEGVKPEVLLDEFGVPLQNRAKEYERKNLELQAEIRGLKEKGKQEEADDLEAFLKAREDSDVPLTNVEIKKLYNAMGKGLYRSVAKIIGPMMASPNIIEAQIDRLKARDGFEPKAESLLRSKLREAPPELLVNNPEGLSNSAYDMVLGQLTREGKIGGKPKQPKKTPGPSAPKIESPGVSSSKGKKPPSEAEKKEAEDKHLTVERLRAVKEKREKGKKDREKK